MYCIFSENSVSLSNVTHVRQLKEDINGNYYPLLADGRAIIEPRGDTYIAKSSAGEVIAVSDNLDVIIKRINYAQPNVEIIVNYDGKYMTIEQYEDLLAPTIYRISNGYGGDKTKYIAKLDYIENGKISDIKTFFSADEVVKFIIDRQSGNDHYYFLERAYKSYHHIRGKMDVGGYDYLHLNSKQLDTKRLSKALREERTKQNENQVAGKQPTKRNVELKDGKFNVLQLYEK